MSNPSHGVNAYAKQIALHLYQYPIAVKWGGSASLELSSPSPPPFTPDKKEYGLHFAADASPGDETRGITGGVGMRPQPISWNRFGRREGRTAGKAP